MKFVLFASIFFFLIVPQGRCGTDVPELIDQLDTLFVHHQLDSLISLGEATLARAEEESGPEDTVIAEILVRLIRAYQAGQKGYATTERYMSRALRITEQYYGHNHKKVAAILNNMAINRWLTGRFEAARDIYEESFNILQSTGNENTREMAAVTNNLAALCHTIGDYARAEQLYLMSLPIRERVFGPDHVEVGKCHNNLGTLYLNLRLFDKAKKHLDISLDKKKKAMGNDDPDVASALLNLATLYTELSQYENAEDCLTEALEIYKRKYGDNHSHTLAVELDLGMLRFEQKRYHEADSIYAGITSSLLSSMGQTHPMLGMVYHSRAQLKEMQNLDEESMRLMNEALQDLESTYGQSHSRVASCKEHLARLQCRAGAWTEAEDNSADACEIRNQLLNRNVTILNQSDALESSWFAKTSLDYYLSCLFHNGRIEPFDTSRALDLIINSKGQVADCIFRRIDKLAREQDTAAQRIYAELGNLKFTLSNLLSRKPDRSVSSLKEELIELDSKIDIKEKELADISTRFRLEKESNACTMDMITDKLPDGAVILDYIFYKQYDFNVGDSTNRYLVVVIDKNRTSKIVELGNADTIDRQVERLRNHMLQIADIGSVDDVIDMAEYRTISGDLRASVWDPVAGYISNVENILISPDGALNLLPFSALPVDGDSYLIEKYVFHYLPSSRDIIRYGDEQASNEGLLAVGAPDFDADLMGADPSKARDDHESNESAVFKRGMSRKDCGLLSSKKYGSLPGAQSEVQAIAANWVRAFPDSVVVLTGIEATEENFIANSEGKRFVHIATHGFFMDGDCFDKTYLARKSRMESSIIENPLLFSGLLFTGANNRDNVPPALSRRDGVMTANDITTLNFRGVSLVVLSACESGLGQVINSEGVYGLRRAFMEAGAQCVVSTLWPIIDDRAYPVLYNLYTQTEGGVARKLQEAQKEIIKNNRAQNKCNHPFFWGAFVVCGRWTE